MGLVHSPYMAQWKDFSPPQQSQLDPWTTDTSGKSRYYHARKSALGTLAHHVINCVYLFFPVELVEPPREKIYGCLLAAF